MANKKPVKRKRAKATPRRVRKPKAVKDLPLTKLDVFYIEMKMVFDAAKKAGFDEANALRIAYDREAYPEWIVPADDPIKKIGWEDGEEDV
jgi:hypothetical protein